MARNLSAILKELALAARLTVMEVSMVMLRAYERTRPKVEAFPRCSTVSTAAARAAIAPRVSSLTLSHLQVHDLAN